MVLLVFDYLPPFIGPSLGFVSLWLLGIMELLKVHNLLVGVTKNKIKKQKKRKKTRIEIA
jgi:hypothetical protein